MVPHVRPVPYTHADAVALVAEIQDEYRVRYGDPDWTPVDPAQFEAPHGVFLVAYEPEGADGGRPVGCGAWRAVDDGYDPQLRTGDAELKRLYVRPEARGRGLARHLVARIEEHAAEAGRRRMVLETGTEQPEAIALYGSLGYAPMANFGMYRDEPQSRCFAKPLPGDADADAADAGRSEGAGAGGR